jgi:hypothetical protein
MIEIRYPVRGSRSSLGLGLVDVISINLSEICLKIFVRHNLKICITAIKLLLSLLEFFMPIQYEQVNTLIIEEIENTYRILLWTMHLSPPCWD